MLNELDQSTWLRLAVPASNMGPARFCNAHAWRHTWENLPRRMIWDRGCSLCRNFFFRIPHLLITQSFFVSPYTIPSRISNLMQDIPTSSTAIEASPAPGVIDHGDVEQGKPVAQQPEDPALLRKIRRKVDWRLVLQLFFCYLMGFLDKVAYNVSDAWPRQTLIF